MLLDVPTGLVVLVFGSSGRLLLFVVCRCGIGVLGVGFGRFWLLVLGVLAVVCCFGFSMFCLGG